MECHTKCTLHIPQTMKPWLIAYTIHCVWIHHREIDICKTSRHSSGKILVNELHIILTQRIFHHFCFLWVSIPMHYQIDKDSCGGASCDLLIRVILHPHSTWDSTIDKLWSLWYLWEIYYISFEWKINIIAAYQPPTCATLCSICHHKPWLETGMWDL